MEVWHRKSAFHGLPVTLHVLRVKLCACTENWTLPEEVICGAHQKESGLWGREWATCVSVRHAHCNRKCHFLHFKQNLRGSCSHRLLVKVDEDSGSAPNWKIEDNYCSSPFTNICYFVISGCFTYRGQKCSSDKALLFIESLSLWRFRYRCRRCFPSKPFCFG